MIDIECVVGDVIPESMGYRLTRVGAEGSEPVAVGGEEGVESSKLDLEGIVRTLADAGAISLGILSSMVLK
jgi:hypothetical protein